MQSRVVPERDRGACLSRTRQPRASWFVVFITLAVAQATAGAQRPAGTVLKSVQVAVDKGLTLVTIEADGALPLTVGRALEDPARIYFDLPGVSPLTGSPTTVLGAGLVSRVRISLNSPAANVTRVVLDLESREDFTIRAEGRQAGRLQIVVGRESSQPRPNQFPVPSTTPASVAQPAASTPTMVTQPEAPAQAREVVAYRQQLLGALDRIKAQRSVLAAIAADAEVTLDALRAAQADFTDLRRIVEASKPPTEARSAHDLLISSCKFGAAAAGLRIDTGTSPTARRNAASAAAGSLMLLDKACADLGCAVLRT